MVQSKLINKDQRERELILLVSRQNERRRQLNSLFQYWGKNNETNRLIRSLEQKYRLIEIWGRENQNELLLIDRIESDYRKLYKEIEEHIRVRYKHNGNKRISIISTTNPTSTTNRATTNDPGHTTTNTILSTANMGNR